MSAATSAEVAAQALAEHEHWIAPMFWAFMLGSVLSGFVLMLSIQWLTEELRTSTRFETVIVVSCTICTLAMLGLETTRGYLYLIRNSDNPYYTDTFHIIDYVWCIFCILGNVVSQSWFTERAWRSVGRSRLFLLGALAIGLCEVSTALAMIVIGSMKREDEAYWELISRLLLAWFVSSALLDILNAALLVYQVRRLLDFSIATDVPAQSFRDVTRLAFATGTLNSTLALVGVIVYALSWRTSNAWIPILECVAHLAIFSCLITIYSRRKWRMTLGLAPEFRPPPVTRLPPPGIVKAALDTSAFERLDKIPSLQKAWDQRSPKVEDDEIKSSHELDKAIEVYDYPSVRLPELRTPVLTPSIRRSHKIVSVAAPRRLSNDGTSTGNKVVTVRVERQVTID